MSVHLFSFCLPVFPEKLKNKIIELLRWRKSAENELVPNRDAHGLKIPLKSEGGGGHVFCTDVGDYILAKERKRERVIEREKKKEREREVIYNMIHFRLN